jgi:hypothetical protein
MNMNVNAIADFVSPPSLFLHPVVFPLASCMYFHVLDGGISGEDKGLLKGSYAARQCVGIGRGVRVMLLADRKWISVEGGYR